MSFDPHDRPIYEQVAGDLLFSPDPFRPAATPPPVEDWSVGGDLDPRAPDWSDPEVTDPGDPNYVDPWWPA